METRVNTLGEKEVKIQPEGLPAIWVKMYCDRCRRFQECLGFNDLNEDEWQEMDKVISDINLPPATTREIIKRKYSLNSKPDCMV